MAATTGRFGHFVVVSIAYGETPPLRSYPLPARPPRLPRATAPVRERRHEDWSDIEALLTAPPWPMAAAKRTRRRTLPLMVSATVATAAFAGVITAAFFVPSRAGCDAKPEGCVAHVATTVPTMRALAPMVPAPAPAELLATPVPKSDDVVDAQAAVNASPSVVQGRSVAEDSADAPGPSAPRHHRKRHHHRYWW